VLDDEVLDALVDEPLAQHLRVGLQPLRDELARHAAHVPGARARGQGRDRRLVRDPGQVARRAVLHLGRDRLGRVEQRQRVVGVERDLRAAGDARLDPARDLLAGVGAEGEAHELSRRDGREAERAEGQHARERPRPQRQQRQRAEDRDEGQQRHQEALVDLALDRDHERVGDREGARDGERAAPAGLGRLPGALRAREQQHEARRREQRQHRIVLEEHLRAAPAAEEVHLAEGERVAAALGAREVHAGRVDVGPVRVPGQRQRERGERGEQRGRKARAQAPLRHQQAGEEERRQRREAELQRRDRRGAREHGQQEAPPGVQLRHLQRRDQGQQCQPRVRSVRPPLRREEQLQQARRDEEGREQRAAPGQEAPGEEVDQQHLQRREPRDRQAHAQEGLGRGREVLGLRFGRAELRRRARGRQRRQRPGQEPGVALAEVDALHQRGVALHALHLVHLEGVGLANVRQEPPGAGEAHRERAEHHQRQQPEGALALGT
jgi:hypothetical protein